MAIEVINGDRGAVLYCNTTGWAFGPVFDSGDDARAFEDWMRRYHDDPRRFSAGELESLYGDWLAATEAVV